MLGKSVAIVGSGPSGIITLLSLLDEGFSKIKVFERRSEIGGCWIQTPPDQLPSIAELSTKSADSTLEWNSLGHPKKRDKKFYGTANYPHLHTNVHKITMEFTGALIPNVTSQKSVGMYGEETPFRHNEVLRHWLQGLIDDKYVTLGTSVEKIRKNGKQWELLLADDDEKVWTEKFDAVVVANGRYDVPFIPDVPGLQEFHDKKLVIHSKSYRTPEQFRDMKVVVVGGSISAGDSVQDLIGVAREVISSKRSSSAPHKYFGNYAFKDPRVQERQDLLRIEGDTVYFRDGVEKNVDAIIYGTGYTVSFPFLDRERTSYGIKGIYKHIFNINDPSLYFVGNINAGLTFKVFQWQAVAVAKHLAGEIELPSIEEMSQWEEERAQDKGPDFGTIYPDFKEYFEDLRSMSGADVLPEWDQDWENKFWEGHELRIEYWKQRSASYRI